jgi:hypothetical protein
MILGFELRYSWPLGMGCFEGGTFPSKEAGKVGSFAALPFVGFLGSQPHQYKAKGDSFLKNSSPAVRKAFWRVKH